MHEVNLYGTRVIAVGDPYQLPPVEQETDSVFFDYIQSTLTIPMRYQGPISKVAGIYKNQIDNINEGYGFDKWALNTHTSRKDNFEGDTGYGFTNQLDDVIEMAAADVKAHPETPSYARVLAFKNDSVAEINKRIRRKLYGENLRQFEPGEIVICNGGYSITKTQQVLRDGEWVPGKLYRVPVLYNGQILKVESHTSIKGPYDIPCEIMSFYGLSGVSEPIYVVSDTSEANAMYKEKRDKLKSEAIKQPAGSLKALAWKRYYDFVDSFAYFDYAYSVNLYKA
jgi:hypothetical protein